MDKEKEIAKRDGALGSIRIADEVVSIIAGLAATESGQIGCARPSSAGITCWVASRLVP